MLVNWDFVKKGKILQLNSNTQNVLEKAKVGNRITKGEALILFESQDILSLGETADTIRFRLHPEKIVTYIVDRNINYTNVCISLCKFCAFSRSLNHPEIYTISRDELYKKIDEIIKIGGSQILLQGGLHPNYKLEWYGDLLRFIKSNFKIHIHGFSPPEIIHFAKINKMNLKDVIIRLKDAGLDTIPGGGAEILVDHIRKEISPNKCTSEEWLEVMCTAHKLGMRTTATMVYGHIETAQERVEHFDKIRQLQDKTGGFTAFIAWSFQKQNTQLSYLPQTSGFEYLKTLAVSRIYLDNISNIQASWVTQGDKIGQMALKFGANDMGSTMFEENVVASAGCNFRMTELEIRHIIEDLGYIPKRRNCYYEIINDIVDS